MSAQVVEMSFPSFDLGFSNSLVDLVSNLGVKNIGEPCSDVQSQPSASRSRAVVTKSSRARCIQGKNPKVDSNTSALNLNFSIAVLDRFNIIDISTLPLVAIDPSESSQGEIVPVGSNDEEESPANLANNR